MKYPKDLIESLKTRYEIVLGSGSNQYFYQNLHNYYDFIQKTSEIKDLIDRDQKRYSIEHGEIWNERPITDKEADEKEKRTIKLERFSLYAQYTLIYYHIYLPIEEYKNPTLQGEDPLALILMNGPESISEKDWPRFDLKLYTRRFYREEARKFYENKFRQFHLLLITEIEKIGTGNDKPEMKFDKENSVFYIGGKKVLITQKNNKPNSHYVLEYIFDNEEGLGAKSYYSEILENKFDRDNRNWRSLYRACQDINKKVSEQANISNFLIIKSGKTGYIQINPEYL